MENSTNKKRKQDPHQPIIQKRNPAAITDAAAAAEIFKLAAPPSLLPSGAGAAAGIVDAAGEVAAVSGAGGDVALGEAAALLSEDVGDAAVVDGEALGEEASVFSAWGAAAGVGVVGFCAGAAALGASAAWVGGAALGGAAAGEVDGA